MGENKEISDLKFTINNKDVSICAIVEPDPYNQELRQKLEEKQQEMYDQE